jgi:Fe-S-cluster-containing dehydrogenase component
MELTTEQLTGASRKTRRGLRPGKRGGAVSLPKKRVQLAINQCWRCHWCAQACREDIGWMNSATIEHVLPRSQGGPNEPWNLVMACHRCNTARHDQCWESFEGVARRFAPDQRTIAEAQIANKRAANKRRKAKHGRHLRQGRFQHVLATICIWMRAIPA